MKNTLLAVGVVLMGLSVSAQTRVIEYPVTGARTTDALEFYQVEISDTAVVLKGDMYSRPNSWVSIASSSVLKGRQTGKMYRLIRATGINLDNKEYMPISWNRSFTLQFESIDKRDESVDFDEMLTGNNGFQINGISLKEPEQKKKIHCRVEGQVIDNLAYSRLMLMPEGTDPRVQEWISVPVRDGKFSYDLYVDKEEPYILYAWSDQMNGAWRPISFFSENGKIELTLYSMEKEPEIHSDAPLTSELLRFRKETNDRFMFPLEKERERLEQEGKVETPEMKVLLEQFKKTKDRQELDAIRIKAHQLEKEGKAYTEEYKVFEQKSQEVYGKYREYQNEYIQSNPTLVGLYLLTRQARRMHDSDENMTTYTNLYRTVYVGKFADNPMTEYMEIWVASNEIKIGGKFVDFTAPDLQGVQYTLSEEIQGKVALIDLWASWCGPCRRTSISMIPVYETYKDKGFVVVGVARERKAADMKNAVAKDKYPWLNLLELNDVGKIWERYGVGNGGGCTYLVDKNGKILAIHPTAEEVRTWLEKLLSD
ncbi:redoxin domain-containing protein [Bacteroides xylanisolvens]|uniref:redoxin domain-containing protein n=1 Tax=Bacteroides xylanisolvens TaxID=371601 RepID=UPI001BAC93A3|nr:redoxin domain-containing protein [Bacteroides xylanisolvens]QUR42705.1 redoxin domain-containing protein [Bacteroides xylanisolvens]